MENGNCCALTVICMLTSFVSIVPVKNKKTETMIMLTSNIFTQIKVVHSLSSLTMEKNSLVPQWQISQTN